MVAFSKADQSAKPGHGIATVYGLCISIWLLAGTVKWNRQSVIFWLVFQNPVTYNQLLTCTQNYVILNCEIIIFVQALDFGFDPVVEDFLIDNISPSPTTNIKEVIAN